MTVTLQRRPARVENERTVEFYETRAHRRNAPNTPTERKKNRGNIKECPRYNENPPGEGATPQTATHTHFTL
jgi:hypothetical protein